MDLVNLRLTGRAATQRTAFAPQLCDNRQVPVTSYDDELQAPGSTRRLTLLVDGTVGELDGAVSPLGCRRAWW